MQTFPPHDWEKRFQRNPSPKPKNPKRIPRDIYHRLKHLIEAERAFGHQQKARQAAWAVARFYYTHCHPVRVRKYLPTGYYCSADISSISRCTRIPERTVQRKISKLIQYGFIQRKRRGYPITDTGTPYSYYWRSYWRVATTLQEWLDFSKEARKKDT